VDTQKLNDLIYEIQNLVRTLGRSGQSKTDPGSSGNSGMTDKSATQLIAALGILASKLGGAAQSRRKEIRAAEDFATTVTMSARRTEKAIQDTEKAAKKHAKKLNDAAEAAKAAAEQLRIAGLSAKEVAKEQADAAKKIKQDALQAARDQKDAANAALTSSINDRRLQKSSSREVYEAAHRAGGGLSQLNDKFLDLGKGSVAAQSGLQLISAVVGGTTKALLNYSSAIQNGERGAKLSGKALEDFANPILDTVSTLGTLAMVLPGVGKYLGKGAGAAAKLTGRFMKLGGATAVAGAEIAKFGIKFVQAGLTQADKVFDSFQKLSQVGIAGAGGMDDVFGMLQELGLSSGEIEKFNTLIAANAQTIKFLGATATDGANQLAKVAGGLYKSKLGRQLEIMGVNQAEQNELALIQLSIEAKSIGLQKMQNRGTEESNAVLGKFVKELDMAAQLTGTSRKDQAEAQAAAQADERFRAAMVDARNRGDQKEIDRLNKAAALAALIDKTDKKGATGIRQLAASGGAMTTPEAQAAQQTYGINEILNSQGSLMDAAEQLVENGRRSQAQFASVNKYIGTISSQQTGVVETANVVDQIGPAVKAAKDAGLTLEQYQKREQEKREAPPPGKDTTLMVDSLRMQQNAALIQDQAAKQLSSAATVHSAATTAFEAAVKKFGEVTGTLPKSQITTGGAEVEAAKKAAYDKKLDKDSESLARGAAPMGSSEKNVALLAKEMKDRGITEEVARAQRIADSIIKWFSNTPTYATGGIAAGPDSGHLAMLHGTEAVIPLAGGAIPVAISGGAANKGDVGSGPAFSKANEFAAQMDKVIKALDDSNKYLSDIYDEISGGATVGGAGSGSGSSERVAQEALAEHDHAHPHEPAAAPSAELAAQIGKIVNPLVNMNQTSGMMRNDGKTFHGGIDLAGKIGDKVMAPISGIARVLSEKESGGYGNMVEVTDSVTGVKHMLAHLDKSMVKSGDVIKAGQQIGTLGNTGKSTGAHLHHEMRDKFGNKIDPSSLYSKGPGDTFGSTAGGAATGNPQAARRGQKYGATQAGAPTDMATYMKTVAMLESGGDPNAKAGTSNGKYSSAGGLFQFLESSYEGVTGRKGSGAERFDPKKSTEAMQKLTMMNKGQMEKGLGREVSGEDLYMGHFLGAGGATKFLKAKDQDPNQSAAKFDPAAAESNKSIYYDQKNNNRERSVAEVHSLMTEKYRKQQAAIQGGAKLPDVVAALGTGGMPLAGGAPPTAVAAAVPGYAPEQRAQPAAQPTTLAGIAQNLLGGLFGSSGTTAGIAGPTAPAAGSDMAGITAALQAQTAATQSAITSSMENMTTRLVASLGTTGGISGGDPAVPALLGDIVSAQRDQTAAINRLISVQTA